MRPNLARFHATSLEFWCHLDLEPPELERLTSAFAGDKDYADFPWRFRESYRVGRAHHFGSALVARVSDKTTAVHLHFEFSRGRVPPAGFEVRPLSDLIGLISQRELQATFDCTVTLEYAEKEWVSLVSLPMRLVEYRDLPFDEFRGFRAVKTENGRIIYSVIIDRGENKAILHVVQFSHFGRMDTELADTILREGARISSLFIRRKEG